ncbi:MAG: mechanosensitive ion channel domain-containing protein [Nanoarchaeota archaeon]
MIELSALSIKTFLENPFFLRAATAGVIISAGIIAAHFVGSAFGLLIQKAGLRKWFGEHGIKNPTVLIQSISKYLILVLAFFLALKRLGLFEFVIGVIVAVIIGLVMVASYLELRDSAANLFAYIFVSGMKFKKGDIIKISGIEGKVRSAGLLEVVLEGKKDDIIVIPNRLFLKAKVHRQTL